MKDKLLGIGTNGRNLVRGIDLSKQAKSFPIEYQFQVDHYLDEQQKINHRPMSASIIIFSYRNF